MSGIRMHRSELLEQAQQQEKTKEGADDAPEDAHMTYRLLAMPFPSCAGGVFHTRVPGLQLGL